MSDTQGYLSVEVIAGGKSKGTRMKNAYCELHQDKFFIFSNIHAKTPKLTFNIIFASINLRNNVLEIHGTDFILNCSGNSKLLREWYESFDISIKLATALSMQDFQIIRVLGKGYFGKVFLVNHTKSKEQFALKASSKQFLIDHKQEHVPLNEKSILISLCHPFIINYRFSFQSVSTLYLGLEYVPGGDLLTNIKKHLFISPQSIKIAIAEISLALEYMHNRGIVYRDLKLENVLVATDGHIKIADFGLSEKIGETQSSTFCGTSSYIPPEMIRGIQYSFEVDWWQLGVLTFELLFERPPFIGESKEELYQNICYTEPKFPSGADPKAVSFIKKLLVKNQNCRGTFQSLKTHEFWDGLNFNDVLEKKAEAPFYVYSNDSENFDSQFTNLEARESNYAPIFKCGNAFKSF